MFHLVVTGSVQLVFPTHWQNQGWNQWMVAIYYPT
jgi:hypothetical protein